MSACSYATACSLIFVGTPPQDRGFAPALRRQQRLCPDRKHHRRISRTLCGAPGGARLIGDDSYRDRSEVLTQHTLCLGQSLSESDGYLLARVTRPRRFSSRFFGMETDTIARGRFTPRESTNLPPLSGGAVITVVRATLRNQKPRALRLRAQLSPARDHRHLRAEERPEPRHIIPGHHHGTSASGRASRMPCGGELDYFNNARHNSPLRGVFTRNRPMVRGSLLPVRSAQAGASVVATWAATRFLRRSVLVESGVWSAH